MLQINENEINQTKRKLRKFLYFLSHQWTYAKRDAGDS